MLYWMVPAFLWLGSQTSQAGWWGSVVFSIVIVVVLERQLFGHSIELFPDHLIYRYRGHPWPRAVRIRRTQIIAAKREVGVRRDGNPWDSVSLVTDDGTSRETVVLSLVTFSRRDVERLLHWLSGNGVFSNTAVSLGA